MHTRERIKDTVELLDTNGTEHVSISDRCVLSRGEEFLTREVSGHSGDSRPEQRSGELI